VSAVAARIIKSYIAGAVDIGDICQYIIARRDRCADNRALTFSDGDRADIERVTRRSRGNAAQLEDECTSTVRGNSRGLSAVEGESKAERRRREGRVEVDVGISARRLRNQKSRSVRRYRH